MVIPGRDRGAGPRLQPRPAKGAPCAARTQPSARTNGVDTEDELSRSDAEVDAAGPKKAARLRKSRRLQNAKLRRSSRLQTRGQRSNMFDGLSTSSVRLDLKAVSDMKNKNRLVLSNISRGTMFRKSRTLLSPRSLSDVQEENGEEMLEKDEDSDCGQSIDAKTSRASSLYNETRANDFLKSTFRIGASGPNTALRGGYRARPSPWIHRADSDDDSDDSDAGPPLRCRPLNQDRLRSGAGLADIDPMAIDQTVGFDSIGGLSSHISALKEMVVFPLLYHEVFDNFKIQPPRSVLTLPPVE